MPTLPQEAFFLGLDGRVGVSARGEDSRGLGMLRESLLAERSWHFRDTQIIDKQEALC